MKAALAIFGGLRLGITVLDANQKVGTQEFAQDIDQAQLSTDYQSAIHHLLKECWQCSVR